MLGHRSISEAALSSLPDAGGGGPVTISATPGAYSWAGATASLALMISAAVGAYSWTGTTSTVTVPPLQINATAGAYTWAGTTAEIPAQIPASPGSYTWSGTTSTFGGVVQVDAAPGAWSWAGVAATLEPLATDEPHQGGVKRLYLQAQFKVEDEERKRLRREAQGIIQRIKAVEPQQQAPQQIADLEEDAAGVSARIQDAIARLEAAADAYEQDMKRKQAQQAMKQASALALLMAEAERELAAMQQQAEELDVAWVMMMIAAHA